MAQGESVRFTGRPGGVQVVGGFPHDNRYRLLHDDTDSDSDTPDTPIRWNLDLSIQEDEKDGKTMHFPRCLLNADSVPIHWQLNPG